MASELSVRVEELEEALLDLATAVEGLKIEAKSGVSGYLMGCLRRPSSWVSQALGRARAVLETEPQEHETDG